MLDFKAIELLKAGVADKGKKNKDISLNLYLEGVDHLKSFQNNMNNLRLLKQAADKFTESLKYKSNNPEALICLSYIFFVLDKDKTALKFFKAAELLDPNHFILTKFKELFSRNFPAANSLLNPKSNNDHTPVENSNAPRPEIKKIQRIRRLQ
jgi:hypothetical protein